jgi:hypothetical protein
VSATTSNECAEEPRPFLRRGLAVNWLHIPRAEPRACSNMFPQLAQRRKLTRSKSACFEKKQDVKLFPMRGEFYDIERRPMPYV